MNNGFGWARLPKSFMAENTVFLLLTALIRNFFKFISVPAKWIKTARLYQLNIYTHNKSYQNPFAPTDG